MVRTGTSESTGPRFGFGIGSPSFAFGSELLQRAVHELNANGALAHGGGNALDAARARVSHAKHTGDAGLHQVGAAGRAPVSDRQVLGHEIGAGLHELLVVEQRAAFEPAG